MSTKEIQILKKVPSSTNPAEVLSYIDSNKIDYYYFNIIKDISSFPDEMISDWFDINVKTYRNYKSQRLLLGWNLQEKSVMLLSLFKHGIEVFGTKEKFSEWLGKENFFFNKKKPIDFFKTISGIKFVDNRLTALEYGDNA